MKRIAIQGFMGSFHDIAARQYFSEEQIQLNCCATFEQVFEQLKRDPTVIGLVAIENTIAGSLLHNYDLLRASGMTVVGEHKLHIQHCICCLGYHTRGAFSPCRLDAMPCFSSAISSYKGCGK